MSAPTNGGGEPVVVADAQELRSLANAARSARSAVDYALSRMAGIMGPLDRRGWNAGAADGTWTGARSGLQRVEAELEHHAAILDARANLVDHFETRAGCVLDLVEPDGSDWTGQPTYMDNNMPATDASTVQARSGALRQGYAVARRDAARSVLYQNRQSERPDKVLMAARSRPTGD